jgi:hypothetical protein
MLSIAERDIAGNTCEVKEVIERPVQMVNLNSLREVCYWLAAFRWQK